MTIQLLRPVNTAASENAGKNVNTPAAHAAASDKPSFGQLLEARQGNGAQQNTPAQNNTSAPHTASDGALASARPNAGQMPGGNKDIRVEGPLVKGEPGNKVARDGLDVDIDIAGQDQPLSAAHGKLSLAAERDATSAHADSDADTDVDTRADDALPAGLVWREITALRGGGPAPSELPAQPGSQLGRAQASAATDRHVVATLAAPAVARAALADRAGLADTTLNTSRARGTDQLTTGERRTQRESGLNAPAERTIDLRDARDGTRQLPADDRSARALHAATPANDGAAAQNATRAADRVAAAFGERFAERMNTAGNGSRQRDDAAPLAAAASAQTPATQATHAAPAAAGAPAMPNPAAALTAPLGSQAWHQALNQQALRMSHFGDGSAELTLYPRELGKLQVSLKLGEQTQLHFASAHADVRAAVEAALPQLRHAFADNGINLSQTSVSDQGLGQGQNPDSSGSDSAARGSQPGARGTGIATDSSDTLSAPIAITSLAGRTLDGGIDIFA